MMRSRIFSLLIVSLLLVTTAETCSPEFAGLIFTRKHGPDAPINAFTRGEIGIPLPGWQRAYLVVAYRYLAGKPLSQAEADSFADFWDEKKTFGFPADPIKESLDQWIKTRALYFQKSRKRTTGLQAGRLLRAVELRGFSLYYRD